jgi:hypothetical protein
MPLALAACGSEPEPVYTPLRYDYLPPIPLNVATIEVHQQFVPSGARPDVTAQDPVPPITALKAMAQDRLKAFGTTGRAVFVIEDASLTQRGDNIDAVLRVALIIYGPDDQRAGFAEARVDRHRSGDIGNLHKVLYDVTKAVMDDMNVEFEFQIRHNLKDWIIAPEAPEAPVEQTPLDRPPPR